MLGLCKSCLYKSDFVILRNLFEIFYKGFKYWFRNCFRDLFQLLLFFLRRTMPLYAHNLQYHRLQKQRPLTLIWHVETASNPLKVLNFCGDFFSNIHLSSKVIHLKYSKHWLYTVAYTIDCVCSKMSNSWFISFTFQAQYIELYMW